MPYEEIIAGVITNPWFRTMVVSVVRGVAGWLQNALENGKIDPWEWKQLGATVLRVFVQAVPLVSVNLPPELAFLTDLFLTKADKLVKTQHD